MSPKRELRELQESRAKAAARWRKLLALALCGGFVLGLGLTACKKKPAAKESSTNEAVGNLKKIAYGAKGYFERGALVSRSGKVRVQQFPASTPLYPATKCCKGQNKRCPTSAWKVATWTAVGFEITDPHRFQYQLTSSGTKGQAKVTIRAVADPKCDGKYLVLEQSGTVDDQRRVVFGQVTIRRGVTDLK